MNINLIESKEYDNLPWASFAARHTQDNQKKFGAWRWKSIRDHRDDVLTAIYKSNVIVDFGGALAPLGFGSQIIDIAKEDINGNIIEDHDFNGYKKNSVDMIFSSHCIEHIHYISILVRDWYIKLVKDGVVVLNLPSVNGIEYWHPKIKKEHEWLFATKADSYKYDKLVLPVDALLEDAGFKIDICDYAGDNCLFVVAHK